MLVTEFKLTAALAQEIHAKCEVTRKESFEMALKLRANEIARENASGLYEAVQALTTVIENKRFAR